MRPLQSPSHAREITHLRGRARNLERRFNGARVLPVVFDGIGAPLTPGVKGDVAIHFDAEIIRWRLLADQVGHVVIDIWKSSYAGFPPTVAGTITAADLPTLAGADKAEDTALTGWTTVINDGDTLRFHIDSASVITRATLLLTLVTE